MLHLMRLRSLRVSLAISADCPGKAIHYARHAGGYLLGFRGTEDFPGARGIHFPCIWVVFPSVLGRATRQEGPMGLRAKLEGS
jgi:hypothetical protein